MGSLLGQIIQDSKLKCNKVMIYLETQVIIKSNPIQIEHNNRINKIIEKFPRLPPDIIE